MVLLPLVLVGLFVSYSRSCYAASKQEVQNEVLRLGAAIQYLTTPEEIVAIYGYDWNPVIPYYARRRALMDRWEMPLTDPRFQRAMHALEGSDVGCMLVQGARRGDEVFVRQRVAYFGLAPQPAVRSWLGDLFVKERTR
jgi:hypothetical protein